MDLECLSVGLLVADHLCTPISHLPGAGELVLADRLELNIGGCASNAAMDLARVGVKVGVVGCVGHDAFGRFVSDTLREANVDIASIRQIAGVGTSGTLIINVEGEDRRFIHAIGANGHLTAADIPRQRVRQAKVLYVGGYFVMPALAADELARLFREAPCQRREDRFGCRAAGPRRLLAGTQAVAAGVRCVFAQRRRSRGDHGPGRSRAQAEHFRQAGAATVVITCGEAGTVLVAEGLRVQAAAHRVPYVGGTGAGDAFDAGYIAGLLAGGDPLECLAWGTHWVPVASARSAPPTACSPGPRPSGSCANTRCN